MQRRQMRRRAPKLRTRRRPWPCLESASAGHGASASTRCSRRKESTLSRGVRSPSSNEFLSGPTETGRETSTSRNFAKSCETSASTIRPTPRGWRCRRCATPRTRTTPRRQWTSTNLWIYSSATRNIESRISSRATICETFGTCPRRCSSTWPVASRSSRSLVPFWPWGYLSWTRRRKNNTCLTRGCRPAPPPHTPGARPPRR